MDHSRSGPAREGCCGDAGQSVLAAVCADADAGPVEEVGVVAEPLTKLET